MLIIAQILDSEFRRVAKAEDIPMEELVEEVSQSTRYTPRQLYNYRAGKWPIPAELIPYFCMRFKSRSLIDAMVAQCNRVCPVEVPDQYDLAKLSSKAVRDTLGHFTRVLDAFEDKHITRDELQRLEESSTEVLMTVEMFLGIARADYERRQTVKA